MACVIEIRDQELYVMVANKSKGKISVSRAFRVYLSDSLFKNNEVVFTESVINQISSAFENHKIKDTKVQVVINHRIALTKDIIVPKTDNKKLGLIVENEMVSLFNLTKDFIVDYTVLDEVSQDGIQKIRTLTCAIRRSTLKGLENLFDALGMKITSIDVANVSFMNFVHKTNVVDTKESMIIIDASSSYIRYYLFNDKKFVLMRTLYIHVDDDHIAISKRVLHVLELMSQSQLKDTGKPVGRVKLLGFEKRFGMMSALSETYLKMSTSVPNIFESISPEDKELYDYGNTMGVLL